MGFSLTGSHVIFFIASIIVAGAVSGVFVAVTMNISSSINERGQRIEEQLDTEFTIINDPDNIYSDNDNYYFYMKNIGGCKLATTNETFQIFIDGEIIGTPYYYFADSTLPVSEVTTLYILNTQIAAGDRVLRVVGPQAIDDEFEFTV